MLNFTVTAVEEDIDLESFGKKKKKKKVTIEDDEEGGGEKDDGAVEGEFDFVNLVVLSSASNYLILCVPKDHTSDISFLLQTTSTSSHSARRRRKRRRRR